MGGRDRINSFPRLSVGYKGVFAAQSVVQRQTKPIGTLGEYPQDFNPGSLRCQPAASCAAKQPSAAANKQGG